MLQRLGLEGERGDRSFLDQQGAGEGAAEGRGAQLRYPQEPAEVRQRDERPAQGDLRPAGGMDEGRGGERNRGRHAPRRHRGPRLQARPRKRLSRNSGTSKVSTARRDILTLALDPLRTPWAEEEGITAKEVCERITPGGGPMGWQAKDAKFGAARIRPHRKRIDRVACARPALARTPADARQSASGDRAGADMARRQPLTEYRTEAFHLFESMLGRLATAVTALSMRVGIVSQ